jgi:hypothetical protein
MTTTTIPYRDLRTRAEEIADAELKERILKGIALLEKEHGPDWVDKIDPATLLLNSPTRCVLGQLYGDYARGCQKLALLSGVEYGFAIALTERELRSDLQAALRGWNKLTEAWKVVIAP